MAHNDGMNYAPEGIPRPVVAKGDFPFAAVGLDHGHINGITQGLIDAGGTLELVHDRDPDKAAAFAAQYGGRVAERNEVLQDASIKMVASAAIPSERGPLGVEVLDHGKHYISDKAPFTTTEQLQAAREAVARTSLTWAVCYSERVQNESAVHAGALIADGAIGTVLQVIGLGPHRLNAPSRPEWFFQKRYYGGILIDIGSHQVEQFLSFAGASDATVVHAKIANYAHPEYPELEDFGDANLVADNGAVNYFRVDWFTPKGLATWGDGRTIIIGTDGYIELRKYIDIAREQVGDHVFLVDGSGEHHIPVHGKVGFPYFGQVILDCLNGTQDAMPQEHTFKAAQLCLKAQEVAVRVETTPVA